MYNFHLVILVWLPNNNIAYFLPHYQEVHSLRDFLLDLVSQLARASPQVQGIPVALLSQFPLAVLSPLVTLVPQTILEDLVAPVRRFALEGHLGPVVLLILAVLVRPET